MIFVHLPGGRVDGFVLVMIILLPPSRLLYNIALSQQITNLIVYVIARFLATLSANLQSARQLHTAHEDGARRTRTLWGARRSSGPRRT